MPQLAALLLVLLVDSLVAPHFWQVVRGGRLFGSPIDILNRAAPVALLAVGMTLVIAGSRSLCGGGDGCRQKNNSEMASSGIQPAIVLLSALGTGILAGYWNGILVAILNFSPYRHPDPDGRRAQRGAIDHLQPDRHV